MSGAGFWARRRAAVLAEEQAEARAQEDQAQAAALAGKDDADILAEMNLPDPDRMAGGDDFAAFMSREVPEHLRRRALRTLWRSNPVLACVDGLNEYDDDYRAAMMLGEAVKTAYQVGRGMTAHLEEVKRNAEVVAHEEESDVAAEESADCDQPDETPATTFVAMEPEPAQDIALDMEETQHAPRRMRFRFEEAPA